MRRVKDRKREVPSDDFSDLAMDARNEVAHYSQIVLDPAFFGGYIRLFPFVFFSGP